MKKLLSLLLFLPLLASCSTTKTAHDPSTDKKAPEPAAYYEGDLNYVLTISDESRRVVLEADRHDNVTVATLTSPEEMSGIRFFDEPDVMRVSLKNGEELTLTKEASAGLRLFFRVMEKKLSKNDFSEGKFSFEIEGCPVTVTLNADGYPTLIETKNGSSLRSAEVEILPEN